MNAAVLNNIYIFSKRQWLFEQSYFLFTNITYISYHIKETMVMVRRPRSWHLSALYVNRKL